MQAIILCGGLSTRLGDITKDTPKILLKVGYRTILDIQLELLKETTMLTESWMQRTTRCGWITGERLAGPLMAMATEPSTWPTTPTGRLVSATRAPGPAKRPPSCCRRWNELTTGVPESSCWCWPPLVNSPSRFYWNPEDFAVAIPELA